MISDNRDQLRMLHIAQRAFVSFKRIVDQSVIVRELFVNCVQYSFALDEVYADLVLMRQPLHEEPDLFPGPRETLSVLVVVSERALP